MPRQSQDPEGCAAGCAVEPAHARGQGSGLRLRGLRVSPPRTPHLFLPSLVPILSIYLEERVLLSPKVILSTVTGGRERGERSGGGNGGWAVTALRASA